MSERLQKLLSRHGLGSRRQIEDWILAGRILLNGTPARLGDRFSPGDRLVVDGKDLTAKLSAQSESRVLAYHKASGESLRGGDAGSEAIQDRLPAVPGSRWLVVNPMNAADSGLFLVSNDGRLVNALKRRSPSIQATYMVRVHVPGRTEGDTPEIGNRVVHDDREVEFTAVKAAGGEAANLWYRVEAQHADRRAAVRSLFESQGLKVSRLLQVRYGPIELPRELARGRHRVLTSQEVAALYELAGIAAEAPTVRGAAKSRPGPARDRRGGPRGRK